MERFTSEICNKLRHYVYMLIDPRNGKTFYIGMGKGNRVFAHIREEVDGDEDDAGNALSLKIDVIKRIKDASLEPIHLILRHGMSRSEALEVEAALIDVTPGLTNVLSGHGSNERGPAHVDQLAEQYGAQEIEFDPNHKLVLIKTRPETVERKGSVYNAVRSAWKLNPQNARKADYVLAVVDGICRGVFVAEEWREVKRESIRYEFQGRRAERKIRLIYEGKRIPNRLRKPGMAAPVLYEGY